jgi:hypothetical protein
MLAYLSRPIDQQRCLADSGRPVDSQRRRSCVDGSGSDGKYAVQCLEVRLAADERIRCRWELPRSRPRRPFRAVRLASVRQRSLRTPRLTQFALQLEPRTLPPANMKKIRIDLDYPRARVRLACLDEGDNKVQRWVGPPAQDVTDRGSLEPGRKPDKIGVRRIAGGQLSSSSWPANRRRNSTRSCTPPSSLACVSGGSGGARPAARRHIVTGPGAA